MEKERDFYFQKLRQIEESLQALEGGESNELVQSLFKILYAPDESAAPAEGEVAPPQEEPMEEA